MTVVGDTMTETFTNCSANAGSSVSGTEVATVTSWVSATSFAYTLTLTNITTITNDVTYGPYVFSGNYSYANGSYSYSYTSTNNNTIVGQPVVTRSGNNATIVTGTSHVNSPSGGWYNAVYSNWTWDITTGKAASGSVAINGANGDTVVITALGNGQYNVDITVSGVTTSYSVTI
jgi:hypothetical protein